MSESMATLYRTRDTIMRGTPAGDHLAKLYYEHGPSMSRLVLGDPGLRRHLTAFISTDDGRTWGGGLMLDERRGVSYPDGQQTADRGPR